MTLPAGAVVGQWIEAEVTGLLPPGARFVEPRFPAKLGELELLESSPAPGPDGFLRWRLRLVAFEAGDYGIPPLVFLCRDEANHETELRTPPQAIVVRWPVPPAGAELRPSRPPVPLPLTAREKLALALAAAALLVVPAVLLLRRSRSQPKRQPQTPVPPPRDRALGDLRELEREIPVPPARLQEFYARVVDVVRRFLVAAEGLAAFHMTSGQILDDAGAHALPIARQALGEVLHAADEVKFGGSVVDDAAQARHITAAKDAVGTWRASAEGRGAP